MAQNRIEIGTEIVTKKHRSKIAADQEAKILQACEGTNLTAVLQLQQGTTLQMSRLNGVSLLELLHQSDYGQVRIEAMQQAVYALCAWLDAFEKHTQAVLGQTVVLDNLHLNNFLLCGDRIVGVDFEAWHFGQPEENTAILLAYLESYGIKTEGLQDSLCRTVRLCRKSEKWQLVENTRIQKQLAIAKRRLIRPLLKQSTAVILAGGQASRMEGIPKQTLQWHGYTFLEHLIFCLDCFDMCVCSVQQGFAEDCILPCWRDETDGQGPLAALATILSNAETPLVFVTACDTPLLTRELIAKLYQEMQQESDYCIVKTADGRIHPLCGIYRKSMEPIIRANLQQGNRKIMRCLEQAKGMVIELDAHLSQCLLNVNTPETYQTMQNMIPPTHFF